MDMEKFRKVYEEYMKRKPKAFEIDIPTDVIIKAIKAKKKEQTKT